MRNVPLHQFYHAINRGIDRNQMERLASLDFVNKAQNLFIAGSSGTGKSFLATALGYQVQNTYNYANVSKMLGSLKIARVEGTIETESRKIERYPLFILDDLFLVPMDSKERSILLDIIEDRHGRKSIILSL